MEAFILPSPGGAGEHRRLLLLHQRASPLRLQLVIAFSYVMMGWNSSSPTATFIPSTRHSASPTPSRVRRSARPAAACHYEAPVIIEDDVWIRPNVTILKGAHRRGAFVRQLSLVTRDVPPRARVLSNRRKSSEKCRDC
jgi:hypothetical protein